MTFVELAILITAASCVVLTGFLVSLMIQARRTIAEAGEMLAKLNAELPSLVAELRYLSHSLHQAIEIVRRAVEPVSELLHAAGEVGQTVQNVHRDVRHSGEHFLSRVAGLGAGIRAAVQRLRKRWRQDGTAHRPTDQCAGDQRKSSVMVQ